MNEVIDPEAFEDCDMTDVIFNYNHSGRVYARTRNSKLTLKVREDGLHMKTVLCADDFDELKDWLEKQSKK